MKHLVICGLRLEYRDIPASLPDRPPLLLLNEGLGSVTLWRDFPEKLAAATGCRVIVGSRAGYGPSEGYATPRTPRYMHDEAEIMLPALISALGLERPVLVGHSDGGSIALIFAGAFPTSLAGLVVMAPHEFVEPVALAGIRAARETWRTSDWRERLGRYHDQPERVFTDWCETWLSPEFANWNIESSLDAIRCPVLAIQGEDDEYATMRQIDIIAERVAGASLLKLAPCGHSPHRDQASAVLAAVDAFVGRLSGSCR